MTAGGGDPELTAGGGDHELTAGGGDHELTAGGGAAVPEVDRRVREVIDGVERLALEAHPAALGEALSVIEEELDALRRGIPAPGPGAGGRPDRG